MTPRYLRPAILDRISPERHAIIQASAGTGKTYTLEHLVIDRVLRGTEVGQILVLTFTEKAATEMRERIRERLRRLLDLAQGAGNEHPPEACWVLDDTARKRIRDALGSFDSATISTIHAFCNGVLGEQAFANRRLFEENTVDGRSLFGAVFVETLREAVRDEELAWLIGKWMEGRTAEELEKLLYECHEAPGHIEPRLDAELLGGLLETFPRDEGAGEKLEIAWKEVRKREGMGQGGMRASTLRDRFNKLHEIVSMLPDAPSFRERCEVGWKLLERKKALEDIASGLAKASSLPGELDALSRFCRELPRVLPPLGGVLAQRLLPLIEVRLAARKQAEGLLDYGDMLKVLRATLESPEGAALVEALRKRYRYAILDEFQDTDEVQWAIFRKLFFEGAEGNFLYAIGDPKQAIYGFRGADVGTYRAAREEILAAGGVEVVLRHCFRATADLIGAYNRIFEQGAPGAFFSGGNRYDVPVACGRPELRLVDSKGSQAAPIHVFEVEEKPKADELLELLATRAAQEIRHLVSPDDPPLLWDEGRGPRPLGYRDIYILYRYGAEGKAIAEALRAQGIPFAFYQEKGLFQRPEAWAWLDLLRALAAPEDPARRLRAWLSPFFAVSLAELPLARDLPPDHPLRQRLDQWAEDARSRRYEKLLSRVLDESGILRRAIATGDERALTNLLHLAELLLERANRYAPACEELADWLYALIEGRAKPDREDGDQQRLETERDAVQLMTLHASKGLEAPVVFLLSKLGKGGKKSELTRFRDEGGTRRFWIGPETPEVKESAGKEEREEAERLLYVGLTRAQARLYLPYAAKGAKGDFGPLLERLSVLREEEPEGFAWEELAGAEAPPAAAELGGTIAWEEEDEDEGEAYAELRRRHLGFIITSYSRMRGFRGVEEEEERIEGERMVVEPGPDELPGGAASGIFLHDVLARIPPEEVPGDFEDFRERPAIRRIFEETSRAHGIGPAHLPHAWRLVWAALSTPLTQGGLRLEGGVVRADRWLAEMEFLYPLPSAAEERGFVKGFVDLIFESGGKVYFADWKSDCLPSFEPAYLKGYVQASYELQIRLYSIALRKLFGFENERAYEEGFGGAFYFFLRGMERERGAGIYFERPSFEVLLDWERELEEAG